MLYNVILIGVMALVWVIGAWMGFDIAISMQKRVYHRILDGLTKDINTLNIDNVEDFEKLSQEQKRDAFEKLHNAKGKSELLGEILGVKLKK